jgi:hypothetical protein
LRTPYRSLLTVSVIFVAAFSATAAPNPIEFQLFKLEPAQPSPNFSGALFEPPVGLYLGAYVEQEPDIGQNQMFKLTYVLKNNHAIYFRYHTLLRNAEDATAWKPIFPTQFAYVAKNSGAGIHLALEPAKNLPLEAITEDVIRPFAEAARDADVPVFVRFASEFNDLGNPWSKNPGLYKKTFQLVSRVMHEIAPNVAMVWTPMAYRLQVIDQFYPGKEYVDWVGVNFYNTILVNGDANQPGNRINPLELLDPIYRKYSAVHPIQISEYAAAHHLKSQGEKDYSAFAIQKMRMLYYGVMLKYPRVKNINWFSVDTINDDPKPYPKPDSRLSNYSLLDSESLRGAYQQLFSEPYFLQFVLRPGETLETMPEVSRVFPRAVSSAMDLKGASWVNAGATEITRVDYLLDGKALSSADKLPYRFTVPTSSLKPGSHKLRVIVRSKNKILLERDQVFAVQ